MAELVGDSDLMVRYQLAFSLGALPGSTAAPALAALAVRDGSDPWMRMALLSSVTGCTGEVFQRLARENGFRASPRGREFLMDLAGQTGAPGRPGDLAVILQALDGPLAGDQALSRGIVLALLGADSSAVRTRLSGTAGQRVRAILEGLLADARTTAPDEKRPPTTRVAAIRALRFAPFAEVQAVLTDLLAPQQQLAVQSEAIATLARFDDDRVPTILLRAWVELSPKLRATAAEALFTHPVWVGQFLDAIEKGTISRADVEPARLELLKSYPDESVRRRASRLFASGPARRQEVVARYQPALQMKGDPGRGKAVFQAQCSTCHRLEGVGQTVGADLSAIRDRGLDAVLLNILDPNREVQPQFLSYVLVTTSGRVLTGMIAVETASSLTIRQPDGREETVLRLEVQELRSTGLSFMPEGLEKQVDVPAMADLLAYLSTVR
jgi:putative heme-binding domain-containing protein